MAERAIAEAATAINALATAFVAGGIPIKTDRGVETIEIEILTTKTEAAPEIGITIITEMTTTLE
ncbi:4826_t:CDS:2, partial [Gigaspora rosea]